MYRQIVCCKYIIFVIGFVGGDWWLQSETFRVLEYCFPGVSTGRLVGQVLVSLFVVSESLLLTPRRLRVASRADRTAHEAAHAESLSHPAEKLF